MIGSAGTYAAGSLYSDGNWGMIIRAKQASPAIADFIFTNSAGTELGRFTGTAFSTGSVYASGGTVYTIATDGTGYGFWGDSGKTTWSIVMSSAGNATYGGRITGDTTSDYNMYYRMLGGGTNRGHVFYGVTTAGANQIVAGVDGDGNLRATGTVTANNPFILNAQTVSANYTVPTNYNASSAGPITINTGVTVTVSTGSTWVIV